MANFFSKCDAEAEDQFGNNIFNDKIKEKD